MTLALGPADVSRFRTVISRRMGLHFEDDKLDDLADILRERLEANGRDRPEAYARLVQGALRAQMERDWLIQLGGILALVEEARLRRPL